MRESMLAQLPGPGVQHGHLLHARVQVASHEGHGVGPFLGALSPMSSIATA